MPIKDLLDGGQLTERWQPFFINPLSAIRQYVTETNRLTLYDRGGKKINSVRATGGMPGEGGSFGFLPFWYDDDFKTWCYFDMVEVMAIEKELTPKDWHTNRETTPPYLYTKHKCYAPELAAAVFIWLKMYADETDPNKYRGREKREKEIMKHLEQEFPTIHQEILEQKEKSAKKESSILNRILVLINPKGAKSPGSTPTPSGKN